MSLKITRHEVNGVTVVKLDGPIVLGAENNALRDKVKELLGDGTSKLVLDVGKVTLVDSSGLGTLVGVHHSWTSRGAALRLCNLQGKLRELLQMTRLLNAFKVSDSEAEAVQALANGS